MFVSNWIKKKQSTRRIKDDQMFDDSRQRNDSPFHYYENHPNDLTYSSDDSSSKMLPQSDEKTSTCFTFHRRTISHCFSSDYNEKNYKSYLNLLQSEEWNHLYLLKSQHQPSDEQEKHLKRLQSTSKFSSILFVYFNSLTPQKIFSPLHRTLSLNHYERLHDLFNSLIDFIQQDNDKQLCLNILQRLNYLIQQLKLHEYETVFTQFPSYVQRILSLLSKDQYRILHIMSKDRQTSIERIQLHLILGLNIQQDKHLLVFSVEQPQGSNKINNYHFVHADRTIIFQWYQLLNKYIKQAKCDHMNKYQEFRI